MSSILRQADVGDRPHFHISPVSAKSNSCCANTLLCQTFSQSTKCSLYDFLKRAAEEVNITSLCFPNIINDAEKHCCSGCWGTPHSSCCSHSQSHQSSWSLDHSNHQTFQCQFTLRLPSEPQVVPMCFLPQSHYSAKNNKDHGK